MLWNSTEAEQATGGESTRGWSASGVAIDSRNLIEGDLFLALRDRRDGHEFVGAAIRAGAAAAVVSSIPGDIAPDAPLLLVNDVQDALTRLGRAGRARSKARIVAVTGSVGKTSTKEMLRHALQGQGRTSAAEQSFNNHWGVPLTLARLPADADYSIVEIGMNNPGEIRPLAMLARPHAAIITTIGPAHLAAFGSIDEIAVEKSSIFAGLGDDGTAILNTGSPAFDIMQQAAINQGVRIVTYGRSRGADWRLLKSTIFDGGTILRTIWDSHVQVVKLAARGVHFAENALGVLAAVESVGADPVLASLELGSWLPPEGRGTRHLVVLGNAEEHRIELIDDSFNANPISLAAALAVLGASAPDARAMGRRGRRVAILGDMLELGDRERDFHAEIANHPSVADIDLFHCTGKLMRCLYDALPPEKRGRWSVASETLGSHAHSLVGPGDVVLVKGSKGSRVSVVADAIRKLGLARQDEH